LIILAFAFACFVFVMAGFMWVAENSYQNQGGEIKNFIDALYFIIVVKLLSLQANQRLLLTSFFTLQTISTVGYGDITPQSIVGRVAIMLIIMTAIALVPFALNILVEVWHNFQGTHVPPNTHHVSHTGSFLHS